MSDGIILGRVLINVAWIVAWGVMLAAYGDSYKRVLINLFILFALPITTLVLFATGVFS